MHSDEYDFESRGGKAAYGLGVEAAHVFGALFDGQDCVVAEDVGRASVAFFPLKHGEGVLRHFRRGGLIASICRDRFLGNRMKREFEVALAYYRAGGPVPEPLGVCWVRRGIVYRGAIAYRRVPGDTLLHYLLHEDAEESQSMLRVAGRSIRHMHDLGVWHADLQLKNMLVAEDRVWMIDFDNARLVLVLGRLGRARNLLRLRRSFEKHGLPMDNFATLLEGYGSVELPAWLDWAYRLRGTLGRLHGGQ